MAYAAGGLFVVLMLGAIVAVLVNDSFAQGVAQAGQFGSLDEARPRAIGFFSYGLVINAAVVVLAYFVQRGVNGTRIALTVLGGFMVASSLARGPVGVIALVYVGLAVMFLWINGANPWFRAQKIARTTVRPVVPPAPR